MKKLFYTIIALLLIAGTAQASFVNLAWDAPDPPATPKSYKIYWGTAPGIYTKSVDVGNVLTAQIDGLENGHTWYFVATAVYDNNGEDAESAYSNEVSRHFPLVNPPKTLKITGAKLTLELVTE